MNSAERVQATVSGQPVDRRAVAPVLCLYGAALTGCPMEKYYTDPEAYAEGQQAVLETFHPDILFGPFAFAMIGAAFGSEIHRVPNQAPNVRKPAVRSIAELERLAFPDPDAHPHLLYLREAVRRMATVCGKGTPIGVPLPPPTDLPALVIGMESWMDTVLFDPDGARRAMARVIPFFLALANSLFADGAALIVSPCAFAAPTVVTRQMAASFARPVLNETLTQLKGPMVLHHGGGPMLAHLDLLAGLPSTLGFALDSSEDLTQARATIGPEPILLAGPSGPGLASRSATDIELDCRATLENVKHDQRFVLVSSGPDIPLATPRENIQALFDAANAVGVCEGRTAS